MASMHCPDDASELTDAQSLMLNEIDAPAAITDEQDEVVAVNDQARRLGWGASRRSWQDLADRRVPLKHGYLLVASPAGEAQLMKDIVLNASEGVIVCSVVKASRPRYPIVFANAAMCRISGYAREDLIGQAPSVLQGSASTDAFRIRIRHALVNGTAVTAEGTNYRKNGTPYDCRVTIFPIHHEGEITHWVGLHSDITDQRRLEDQFHHAQRLEGLGMLAGGVAHDFNNMLTCVLGFTMLAQMDVPAGHGAQDHLRQIVSTCSRAQELIRALMAYSAKGQTVMQPINLALFATETLLLMKTPLHRKAVVITDLDETGATIEANGSQLRQVLMNLLMNAADAMMAGTGEIRVSVRRLRLDDSLPGCRVSNHVPAGDWVELAVRDNGCGMSNHVLAKLFTPLFTTKPNGHGLGLSAVLGILRRHRGHLLCTSEEGEGTEFRLFFQPVPAAQQMRLPHEGLERGGLILVIDEDTSIIASSSELLHRMGFSPVSASNADSGLALCREHRDQIRLAFIDFSMPGKSGIETLRELRQFSDVPVIITTRFQNSAIEPHISTLPAEVKRGVTCLEKPAGLAELSAALAFALA